ncbi:hypothetical protein PsYK624_064000 [Phanerochaete sordida]|uniref:Ubiquitin-like protease family profile domain-containing protein n=1 Tax=Phanerochaete sordida TaxID=48140 RepID=A0A9P3G8P6_9APHY|nr:hypothetical protein PsYK624_064000 [Phanerochaete sordida]
MLLSPLLCSSPCVTAKELLVDEDHSSCPMGSVAGTHGPAEPAPDDDSDEAGDCSRPIAIDSDAYMSHQEPNEPQHVFCMYRRGERAQLTVLWQDVDRLQPGLWLNDTLVELGLRMWYDFELDPALRAQTYLASSFLFESLHSGADPLLRYSRTCNALGPVNIFLYRFLVIPVHDCDHFYMIIVSNPAHCLVSINPGQGAVRSCTTVYPVAPSFVEGMLHPWTRRVEWEDGRTSLSDCPAIWILDSKLPKAIAQKFQRKVTRQTKVIPQGAVHSRLNGGLLDPSVLLNDFISSQAQSLGLSIVWPCSAWELNVPQQDNDCDCGLLAIHYARRFMSDPLTIMRSPSGQEIFDWREQDLPILRAELRDKVRGLRASGV